MIPGNKLRSKGMFALAFLRWLLINCLLTVCSDLAVSAPSLHLLGGISSPTPGIALDASICSRVYAMGCVGLDYFASHNEEAPRHMQHDVQHLSGLFEHAISLGDVYHRLFFQVAAGGAYAIQKVSKDDNVDSEHVTRFGFSGGGAVGFDLPVADLMSFRVGIFARHAVVERSTTQVATLAGIRFGSEWIGFED